MTRTIAVIDTTAARSVPVPFEDDSLVRSAVLPSLRLPAGQVFSD